MKKLISLLILLSVLLSVVFATVSCGDEPSEECKNHADADGDGKCEECGKDAEKSDDKTPEDEKDPAGDKNPDGELDDSKRKALAEIIISQLEVSASAKIDVTLSFVETGSFESDPSADFYEETLMQCTLNLSKSAEYVDLSVYANIKTRQAKDAEFKTRYNGMLMFLVDSVLYYRDIDREFYYQKDVDLVPVSELTSAVRSLLGDTDGPTGAELEEVKDALEDLFLETFSKNGNVASLVINAKDPFNDIAEYFGNLDLKTKTVKSLLDDVFAAALDKVTADALTEKLYELLPLTVNEAYIEIDEFLLAEEGKTLEQIYGELIADEAILVIIENYLRLEGESEENIVKTVNEIKTFSFADAISESGEGETVLADLLIELLNSEGGGEGTQDAVPYTEGDTDSAQEVRALIEELLSMSIEDFAAYCSPDALTRITRIKEVLAGTEINSSGIDLRVTFFEGYNLSHIDCDAEYGFEISLGESLLSQKAEITVKVYDLSMKESEIVVDDAFIVVPPKK